MKTKSTHTPGPWCVSGDEIQSASYPGSPMSAPICEMSCAWPDEITRCNARLISACPELYSLVRSWRMSDPQSVYVDKIDALIKKIEGEK